VDYAKDKSTRKMLNGRNSNPMVDDKPMPKTEEEWKEELTPE
jgi:hypothetical protein